MAHGVRVQRRLMSTHPATTLLAASWPPRPHQLAGRPSQRRGGLPHQRTAMQDNIKTPEQRVIAFRAECPADAEAIRSVMSRWTLGVQTNEQPLEHEGTTYRGMDTEVKLVLRPDAPSVPELRHIWDAIPNAHIAADTLQSGQAYTGEREPRCPWTGDVRRPSKEVLGEALESVVRRQQVLEAELVRMQQTYRELRAMHDLGEKWKPPVSEGNSPGTLCAVQLPGSELTRLILVSPTNPAAKMSPLKRDREVQTRMLVINS